MTPLDDLLADLVPSDAPAAAAARDRHGLLAKPPGSLGLLEDVGVRLAGIAGRCPPPVPANPAVLIAAADHGVHTHGVTAWPQAITARMVELFCAGGAAVNAIARTVGARVAVLDVGCATEPADHPLLRKVRVRAGTADLATGPAMRHEEALQALAAGDGMVQELVGAGVDLLVTGDMGIANTTASACLVAALTGRPAADVTGPGAGADQETLARKQAIVSQAAARAPGPADPVGTLAAVGGLEHAALTGAILSAAAEGIPVVLDGVIADAAALVAAALSPAVTGYLIAGHRSAEPGAGAALDHLALRPLLDLGLRLGEGTGGLLAVPLVVAAARVLHEMTAIADL